MKSVILMMGDPMLDLYEYGYMEDGVFRPTEDLQYLHWGGAANVYANMCAMKEENTFVSTFFRTPNVAWGKVLSTDYPFVESGIYEEIRRSKMPVKRYTMDYQTRLPLVAKDNPGSPVSASDVMFLDMNHGVEKYDTKILVVSDYNKGFVEKHLKSVTQKFDYCIVDSRYANTDFTFLRKISKTLIWRKTMTDAYEDFSWDYRIRSNAEEDTRIDRSLYSGLVGCSMWLPVDEKRRAVNTVGAGDTFTAALAVHIASVGEFQPVEACQYAHRACQEVIGKERTAICRASKVK